MRDLHYLTATQLLKKIHTREVPVEAVITNLVKRIKAVNKQLNALVYFDEEYVLAQAKQIDSNLANNGSSIPPLLGLPVTIKDNLEVQGMVTTGGIKGREGFVPSFDATVVQRLKKAGAIIVGKTNCSAFCAGYETINEVYGRTNNPYDVTRTVGSSSGGEAALIAAGGSYLGIGSDTGGSIRWPASFCGVAGLVPTFGRVPRTGTIPPYLGFLDTTTVGPMARSVEDLALILPTIMGPDNWDPRCLPLTYEEPDQIALNELQIAYYTDNGFTSTEPAVKNVIENAADVLAEKNITVEEQCPEVTQDYLQVVQGLNSFAQNIDPKTAPLTAEIEEKTELYPNEIYSITNKWLAASKKARAKNNEHSMLGVEYHFWSVKADTYRSELLQFMKQYDAIVCPVAAIPAFEHGSSSKKNFEGQKLLSYTHPYSLVGAPSVTIRGGKTADGLPIGFQILTNPGKEELALKLGMYLEDELQEYQRPLI